MRQITKITYEVKRESDVDDEHIYAFQDGDDISVLCRKNDKYFWKPLSYVKHVWYKEYDTIEASIEGVMAVREYKQRACGPIMEFLTTVELITWAHKVISDFVMKHATSSSLDDLITEKYEPKKEDFRTMWREIRDEESYHNFENWWSDFLKEKFEAANKLRKVK